MASLQDWYISSRFHEDDVVRGVYWHGYPTGVLTKTGGQRYPSTSRLLIFCFDVVNRNTNLVDTLMCAYESIDREKKFSEIFLFKKLHVTESKKIFGFWEFLTWNALSKHMIFDMVITCICLSRCVLWSHGDRFLSL